MFTVSIDTIFVLVLFAALALFSTFWVISKVAEWRTHYTPESPHIFRCPICLHIFIAESGPSIVRCPRCQSLSEAKGARIH